MSYLVQMLSLIGVRAMNGHSNIKHGDPSFIIRELVCRAL